MFDINLYIFMKITKTYTLILHYLSLRHKGNNKKKQCADLECVRFIV